MTLQPGKLVLAKDYIHGPADPDVAAYIAAVETADDQGLEEEVKAAYSNFITGCKADGIWDAIKASCILAGARTLDGALVPLAGTAPTNFNFVAADYDRKTGLVGDASTKYLDSNRDNNADPQNNQHLSVYLSKLVGTEGQFYIASDYTVQGISGISDVNVRSRNTSLNNINSNFIGFTGISRSPATDLSNEFVHRSNGSDTTLAKASQTPGSSNIYVFGSVTLSNPYRTDARLAFYSIGESLDLALLDARVSTLISDLGAAIP